MILKRKFVIALIDSPFLSFPVIFYLQVKHRKRNVFDLSAGISEFFDHFYCAVGVACVDDTVAERFKSLFS